MTSRRTACTLSRATSALRLGAIALTALAFGVACGGSSQSAGGTPTSAPAAVDTQAATALERLVAAYHDPKLDPSSQAWTDLLADPGFETQQVAVVEFVRLRSDASAGAGYDAYLDALTSAVTKAGGETVSINDTLMPGLEGLEGYEGGVSWIATFASIRAYVDAMLDEGVVSATEKRRAAVAEAQVLAGPNLIPDVIKQLPPDEPASTYPSGHVTGKSAQQIVDDLMAIYPSGGADPTRETLAAMIAFKGFADQRIHYVNLYKFNTAPGGGAAALNEYNAGALPVVLAHGGRPKVLANVTHHLVGPVDWSRFIFVSWPSFAVFTDVRLDPAYVEAQKNRVASAERYGNLITIARKDRRAAP